MPTRLAGSSTMVSVSPQSPFFHSFKHKPANNGFFYSKSRKNFSFFKTLKPSSSSSSSSSPISEPENLSNETQGQKPDPVKLAFEKAKAYRKSVQAGSNPVLKIVQSSVSEPGAKTESLVSEAKNGGKQEVPFSIKLALEKAKEYKKNKGIVGDDKNVEKNQTISVLEDRNQKISGDSLSKKIAGKREGLTVSSIDFWGLGFADKKINRGLPPGLVPVSESFPDGDIPEVEILVGDTSGFGNYTETKLKLPEEDELETYKPKVSTWGVFPRPSNISKTYGGGRVIRPGEQLETAEDKAAKQKRTRELLAAYRKKTGLSVDPKIKFECEKALEEGDSLMDLGKLKQALTFYQEVMDKLPFQSELHGLAALQWSICQDSLSRLTEARVMYEKLQSHPTVKVSKRAKQFMFGFQAMEMMKVKSTSVSTANTDYQNFFESFIEKKDNYSLKDAQVERGEDSLSEVIPYIVFLVSPIFFVLLIAVRKGI